MISRNKETGAPVLVRLQPDLLAALESYMMKNLAPGTSRPEAVRQVLRSSLMPSDQGTGSSEGIRVSDLNSSNDD